MVTSCRCSYLYHTVAIGSNLPEVKLPPKAAPILAPSASKTPPHGTWLHLHACATGMYQSTLDIASGKRGRSEENDNNNKVGRHLPSLHSPDCCLVLICWYMGWISVATIGNSSGRKHRTALSTGMSEADGRSGLRPRPCLVDPRPDSTSVRTQAQDLYDESR